MVAGVQPRDGYLTVNGLRLHYLDWGGSSSRSLVLVHDIRGYAHMWDDQAQRLSRDFHVYAIDVRGHGESDHSPDGYGVKQLASDVAGLADNLRLQSFALLGIGL